MPGQRTWAFGRLLIVGPLVALLPTTAWAYIDPGHGALVLQALLSGFLGALFLARQALRRLLGRFLTAMGLGQGRSATRPPPDP